MTIDLVAIFPAFIGIIAIFSEISENRILRENFFTIQQEFSYARQFDEAEFDVRNFALKLHARLSYNQQLCSSGDVYLCDLMSEITAKEFIIIEEISNNPIDVLKIKKPFFIPIFITLNKSTISPINDDLEHNLLSSIERYKLLYELRSKPANVKPLSEVTLYFAYLILISFSLESAKIISNILYRGASTGKK